MSIPKIIHPIICWLLLSTVSFAQEWHDAASLKKELIRTALQGKTYYSQCGFYNPRESGDAASNYQKVLQCQPIIYGVDFHYASGTWHKPKAIRKTKENLIKIVKSNWRERRAIACFSWHLENPYIPSGYDTYLGCRYVDKISVLNYPRNHHSVIAEIIRGKGDTCGAGNYSGKDNLKHYPNPRAWFETRCKEVAAIINEFVDDNGKPIPIIFRLWHEWEDGWAWWGARYTSAEDYKKFFILTEQTIRKYAPKAQILWAYCPDRYWNTEKMLMSRYPGDRYVDIIGFDDYDLGNSDKNFQSTVLRAKIIGKVAKERNLATALFETNNNKRKIPEFYTKWLNRLVETDGVNLGIVQIWSLKNFNDSTDMRKFLNMDNIIIDKRLK